MNGVLSLAVGSVLTCIALNAQAATRPVYKDATEYRDAKLLSCMAKVPESADMQEAVAKCEAKANKSALKWKAKQDAKKAKAIAKCMTDTECEATD